MLTKKLLKLILIYLLAANFIGISIFLVQKFYTKPAGSPIGENFKPAPQSSPSQTRVAPTQYADGLMGVYAINFGLLKFANIYINFAFDPVKNEIDPANVTTGVSNGMMAGEWIQTNITNIFSNGSDMFFTVNAIVKNKIAGTPFPVERSYSFNVSYNRLNNTVYFDN